MKKRIIPMISLVLLFVFAGGLHAMEMDDHDVNQKSKRKVSDLVPAVRVNDYEKVKQLLQEGVLVNTQDRCGNTPLLWAVQQDAKMVQLFLGHGADPNIADNNGATPLLEAMYYDDSNACMTELLLKYGACINVAQSETGQTPLIRASLLFNGPTAKKLLAHGAEIDCQDNMTGFTALMHAARTSSTSMVRLLLFAGCDSLMKNWDERTARDLAEELEIKEILENPQLYIQKHPE